MVVTTTSALITHVQACHSIPVLYHKTFLVNEKVLKWEKKVLHPLMTQTQLYLFQNSIYHTLHNGSLIL